jgi:hypothetical protein
MRRHSEGAVGRDIVSCQTLKRKGGRAAKVNMATRGIKAKIDLVELEKLAAMQATDEEIDAFFGVSARTILRRKKVKKFAAVMERGRAKGRLSVRRMQLRLLEQGSGVMAVWLGKNILGQTDSYHHEINGTQINIVCPVQSSAPVASYSGVTIDIGHRELSSGEYVLRHNEGRQQEPAPADREDH